MHKMELSLFLMYTPILKEHNSITQFYQRLKITSIIVHKYKRGLTRLYLKKIFVVWHETEGRLQVLTKRERRE